MNRENKQKQYENGYYKTHACHDTFTCKVCDRPVVPTGAGSGHRNHCPRDSKCQPVGSQALLKFSCHRMSVGTTSA